MDRRIPPSEEKSQKVTEESLRVELPSLETIDFAVWDWIKGKKLFVTKSISEGGFKEIPIMWVGTERAFQIKKDSGARDVSGALILPVITLERGSEIKKDTDFKGQHWANVPAIKDFMGGVLPVGRKLVKEKTADFQKNYAYKKTRQMNYRFPEDEKDKEILYEYHMVPIPVYVTMTYKINILTNYLQHMNEILMPFLTQVSSGNGRRFVISHNGHNFEAWIEPSTGFEGNASKMEDQERQFKSVINIKVLGHIVGESSNIESPRKVKREGNVKIAVSQKMDLK